MKRIKVTENNDIWIKNHFEELINKYAGKYQYVLVSSGKVFPIKANEDIAKKEKIITKKYGRPVGLPIPSPSDFSSILLNNK